jgi:helix-turn-helix protein
MTATGRDGVMETMLMTEKEAAREFKVSLNTMRKERQRQGSGLPFVLIGKQVRYERESLRDWIMRTLQNVVRS